MCYEMCLSVSSEEEVPFFPKGQQNYTSRSIANSQRVSTEINKTVAIVKVRILVE